jgi:cytochrome b subunit of formate dehydrogenase
MSDYLIVLVLALVAALVSGIDIYRTKGQALTPWAVLALAVAVLVDRL